MSEAKPTVVETLHTTTRLERFHKRTAQEGARQTLHTAGVYLDMAKSAGEDLEDARDALLLSRQEVEHLAERCRNLTTERDLAVQNGKALERERDELRRLIEKLRQPQIEVDHDVTIGGTAHVNGAPMPPPVQYTGWENTVPAAQKAADVDPEHPF